MAVAVALAAWPSQRHQMVRFICCSLLIEFNAMHTGVEMEGTGPATRTRGKTPATGTRGKTSCGIFHMQSTYSWIL